MISPEVVYVEGLPASGKTTLLERMAQNYHDLSTVNEYVDETEADRAISKDDEEYFLRNDERKFRIAKGVGGLCLVDRGHLSTVLYNKAHELIKGEQQVDVDSWYHDKILYEGMLPDAYIHLDTEPSTSLTRRPKITEWDNMWDHEEALVFARQGYRDYMEEYEPHVPVLRLDADRLSISEIDSKVVNFLNMERG